MCLTRGEGGSRRGRVDGRGDRTEPLLPLDFLTPQGLMDSPLYHTPRHSRHDNGERSGTRARLISCLGLFPGPHRPRRLLGREMAPSSMAAPSTLEHPRLTPQVRSRAQKGDANNRILYRAGPAERAWAMQHGDSIGRTQRRAPARIFMDGGGVGRNRARASDSYVQIPPPLVRSHDCSPRRLDSAEAIAHNDISQLAPNGISS